MQEDLDLKQYKGNNIMKNEETTNKKQDFDAKAFLLEYAPEIMRAIDSDDHLLKNLALAQLTYDLLGKTSTDITPVIRRINRDKESIGGLLEQCELSFVNTADFVKGSFELARVKKQEEDSKVFRVFRQNIIHFNIILVVILIGALGVASLYLAKDSLALVAAAIGGAINHLLTERSALREGFEKDREDKKDANMCRYPGTSCPKGQPGKHI